MQGGLVARKLSNPWNDKPGERCDLNRNAQPKGNLVGYQRIVPVLNGPLLEDQSGCALNREGPPEMQDVQASVGASSKFGWEVLCDRSITKDSDGADDGNHRPRQHRRQRQTQDQRELGQDKQQRHYSQQGFRTDAAFAQPVGRCAQQQRADASADRHDEQLGHQVFAA
jgi:hypothetical protein